MIHLTQDAETGELRRRVRRTGTPVNTEIRVSPNGRDQQPTTTERVHTFG